MADDDKRGLASADKETRERVAKMGGEASRGGGRASHDLGRRRSRRSKREGA